MARADPMPWPWKAKIGSPPPAPTDGAPEQQAVLVYLRGTGLPAEVYEKSDLVTLEDKLIETIEKAGAVEFDGNEFGPEETVLSMYGPDAERLFEVVRPVLQAYPLCKGARAFVRPGGPDSKGRVVML